jgi:hypothetical protein
MAGAITDIAERTLFLRVPFRAALRRAMGLPRSAWGTAFAHFGLGVTLLGIVAATAWGSERIAEMKIGDNLEIARYRLTFTGLFSRQGPNYHDMVGRFLVRRMNGELIGVMEPSRRSFPSRSRADDARGEPALPLAQRSDAQQQPGGAPLFQAARVADLAWRRDHVHGRRAINFQPARAKAASALQPAE